MFNRHPASVSVVAPAGFTCLACLAAPASAQTSLSDWAAAAFSDAKMHPEYAASIARTAFVWACPMVNTINRRASIGQVPEPGKIFGVSPGAPTNRTTDRRDSGGRP